MTNTTDAPDQSESEPTPTATVEVTEEQRSLVVSALYENLLDRERYLTGSRADAEPRPEDTCCSFHQMRYERDRDIHRSLLDFKNRIQATIDLFEGLVVDQTVPLTTGQASEPVEPAQPTALLGSELIAAERARQITEEGYDAAHDHGHGVQLIRAAESYALVAESGPDGWHAPDGSYVPPGGYPWPDETWKPAEDRVRNLVIAGALIAAAIDSETSTS
jgi:hypothetical protein